MSPRIPQIAVDASVKRVSLISVLTSSICAVQSTVDLSKTDRIEDHVLPMKHVKVVCS